MPEEAPRNTIMAERIERSPVGYPIRFAIAGDSGAWPDSTADAIYVQLLRQVEALEPEPLFFANLGDFAGPGTLERHRWYVGLVDALPCPSISVVGNHDLDDASGWANYAALHGPVNFSFHYGHTRFVVLHSEPGIQGEIDVPGIGTPEGAEGPRDEDLAFLDAELNAAREPHRVVLMHMPPHLGGHYAPHEDWGFKQREREFLGLLHTHDVKLVCCAHGLAFDTHVHEGIRFVMSGGGGTGLCSHYRGVCTAGPGRPEDRGALFHAVELEISEHGDVYRGARSRRSIQAPPARASGFPSLLSVYFERFESSLWQTSSLLLVADGEAVVIDPCISTEEVARIAGRAATLGARVNHVLVTHADWDHVCGMAAFPDAAATMGSRTAEIVAGGGPRELILQRAATYELAIEGDPRVDRALTVGAAHRIGPFTVETTALRGHTDDGTAYRIRELDLLAVGDHLSAVEFPFASTTSEYRTTLASLIDLLRNDPPAHVVPGHGPALTAAEALAIAEADLAYLRALRDAVVEARGDRDQARSAAMAVSLPRPAPDDLAQMHAGNVEAQVEELLP